MSWADYNKKATESLGYGSATETQAPEQKKPIVNSWDSLNSKSKDLYKAATVAEKTLSESKSPYKLSGETTISAPPEKKLSWWQKPFVAGYEAVKGTISDTVERIGDLIDVLDTSGIKLSDREKYQSEYGSKIKEKAGGGFEAPSAEEIKNIPQEAGIETVTKSERAGKMVSAGVGAANMAFLPITAPFAAAEETPLVKYPAKAVGFAFEKLGQGGAFIGAELVDILPISNEAKDNIKGPVSELTGLAAQVVGGKAGFKAVGKIKASIVSKVADRQAKGVEINPNEAKKIINETAKEIPIKSPDTPLSIPTQEGSVVVHTTKRAVLENFIKGQEDINYKTVKSLGKDTQGNKIAARFEWDYKNQKATIYSTKATTASNLAHELGHYFDRKIMTDANTKLSEAMPDLKTGRGQVESALAKYAVEKLNGNATAGQISSTVKGLVDNFGKDIDALAKGETRATPSEKFASAVREVLMNPKKSADVAPSFTSFIQYFSKDKGLIGKEIAAATEIIKEKRVLTEFDKLKKTKNELLKGKKEYLDDFKATEEGSQIYDAAKVAVENKIDFDGTVVSGIKANPFFKKEGSLHDQMGEGWLLTKNGKYSVIEPTRVQEYVDRGWQKKIEIDSLATEAGFENGNAYLEYQMALAEKNGHLTAPEKALHKELYDKDPVYKSISDEVDNLKLKIKEYDETRIAEKTVADDKASKTVSKEPPAETKPEKVETPTPEAKEGAEAQSEAKTAIPEPTKIEKPSQIAGTGLETGKFVEGRKSYNPEKINAPEDVDALFRGISEKSGEFKKQRISKGDEDIKALAQEVGVSVDELMAAKPGSIANAETVYKSRQLVAELAQDLRDTVRSITTETATKEQLQTVKTKMLRLQGAMKTIAGFRTEAANVFRQFKLEAMTGENDIMADLVSQLKKLDDKAGDELSAFTKGTKEIIEPTFKDKLWHLWYASILSGPSTHIKNIAGNLTQLIGESAVQGITDPKGFTVAMKGLWNGLTGEGLREFKRIYREGDLSKFEERRKLPVKFSFNFEKAQGMEKIVRKTAADILNSADYVGRTLSAFDALFRKGAEEMELRAAKRQGYSPEQATKMSKDFGARMTYTQKPDGVIGIIAGQIGQAANKVPGGKFVIPFTRIVANVFNNSLDWTPLRAHRAFKTAEGKWSLEGTSKRARNQQLGRAVLGTAAMAYFASMAADQRLSGNGPTSKKERDILMASGWRPNSVKIGDTWYPYQNWGPLAVGMTLIGNYYDYTKYNEPNDADASSRLAAATLGSVNSLLDMSFLSGVSSLATAIQEWDRGGENYFKRFIAQQAASVVPNLIKQTARYFDTTTYETKDINEMMLSNLRITGGLKPKLNVFGQEIKGATLTQLSPQKETSDETIKFLADKSLEVTIPGKTTKIRPRSEREKLPKGGRQMNDDEYYNYVKYSGIEIKKRLDRKLEYLKKLSPEKAQKEIDSITQDVRDATKRSIEMGIIK